MNTHPKYPHRARDTRSLFGSLVVAAIMLVILLLATSCTPPPRAIIVPQEAGISPGEFAIIAFVSLLFVLRRKRA
jgi:hypothetical protein